MGGVSIPTTITISAAPVNPQTGTTYTLQLSDAPQGSAYQGTVSGNNAAAITFTVPNLAWVVGTAINIIQLGAGQITLAAAGGVTLNTPTSLVTRRQFSTIFLTYLGTQTWTIGGDTV